MDLLIVIGSAEGMAPIQEDLATGMTALFRDLLDHPEVDFKVAVVRMSDGLPVGEPAVLDAEDDVVDLLPARVRLGSDGESSSSGLDSASGAIQSGIFERDDSDLAILFASNRDDLSAVNIEEWVADLQGSLSSPDRRLVVGALAPAGTRYRTAAAFTGGPGIDPDDADVSSMLAEMGHATTGVRMAFRLDFAAVVNSLAVHVGDVAAGPNDWTYNVDSWLLSFTDAAIPAVGDVVSASYSIDPARSAPLAR